jgi:hypothetical protein
MMRTLIKALLPLCLLLTFAGAAAAQTPDGAPPAEETVCDAETGAAYGLCNAYCEAMDCDSDEPSASATACGKVRGKFQNITGRDVPCEAPACPCTSLPEFNEFPDNSTYCVVFNNRIFLGDPSLFIGIFADTSPDNDCGFRVGSDTALPITPEEAEACTQLIRDIAASKNLVCS